MAYPDQWYERLDEWQHAYWPRPLGRQGWNQLAWYYFWRPLCSYVERRLWKGIEESAPQVIFESNTTTGTYGSGINVRCWPTEPD